MEDGQKKHNVNYLPAFLTLNTLWYFQNVEMETYAKWKLTETDGILVKYSLALSSGAHLFKNNNKKTKEKLWEGSKGFKGIKSPQLLIWIQLWPADTEMLLHSFSEMVNLDFSLFSFIHNHQNQRAWNISLCDKHVEYISSALWNELLHNIKLRGDGTTSTVLISVHPTDMNLLVAMVCFPVSLH